MDFILYEAKDRIAAITLNRPDARNAQNKQMLDELDACWTQAAQDEDVRVHGHTWEFGARKAKELLFTAGRFDAHEAHRLGMVNRVVPTEKLEEETFALARQIAEMHPFALAQAKRMVNTTLDIMGQYNALQAVFDVHTTGHGHALSVSGWPMLVDLDAMKKAQK